MPEPSTASDVLPATRWLAVFIAPFLVVAFVILYGWPGQTARLWAWTIDAQMTSMVLASAYLGGAYFFIAVLQERAWAAIGNGFVAVFVFATLLGVATVMHWGRFHHSHVAFWLWAGLYFLAPPLVLAAWVANRREARRPRADEPRVPDGVRHVVVGTSVLAAIQGAVLFLDPTAMIRVWPWSLTPLTARVLGATFGLGVAGIGLVRDARWVTVERMARVQLLMLVLILGAAARAHAEFDRARPLTWVLGVGILALSGGTVWLVVASRRSAAANAGRAAYGGDGRELLGGR
jgi:hypothetical protein